MSFVTIIQRQRLLLFSHVSDVHENKRPWAEVYSTVDDQIIGAEFSIAVRT